MGTYWYAYSGRVTGPFFETKEQAADACDDGETPRPIAESVLPSDRVLRDDSDDSGEQDDADAEAESDDGDVSLDELGHEELKAEAERRGVADDIDLRSKESIRDALRS